MERIPDPIRAALDGWWLALLGRKIGMSEMWIK